MEIAYRWTFRKAVDGEGKYIRQGCGSEHYGHCKVRFEPMDTNSDKLYEFVNAVTDDPIPPKYILAIDKGIQQGMEDIPEKCTLAIDKNVIVLGLKAICYDALYHTMDSSEMDFLIAGVIALREAMKKSDPVLLEPIEKVDVTVPEEYMGDVIGDINSRRGRIEGMEARNGLQVVHGFVPLAEMSSYATDLRLKTQGRGTYSMEFHHYEETPRSIQDKIIASRGSAE